MAIDVPARIAILGAGPIGCEAALYARYLGYDVDLLERGRVCEHLLRLGVVPFQTPFAAVSSSLGRGALAAQDPKWQPPAADALLAAEELVERYFAPLSQSDLLADSLQLGCEVLAIGRKDLLKGQLAGDEERGDGMFRLLVRDANGEEQNFFADVVIDATGVMGQPLGLGAGGLPALGESAIGARIRRFPGQASGRIAIVGDDSMAAWVVAAVEPVAGVAPSIWRIASQPGETSGAMGIVHWHDTTVDRLRHDSEVGWTLRLSGEHAGELIVDELFGCTGFRPNHELQRDLHVAVDEYSDAPRGASPILSEPNYYVLGAKSRGRRADFSIQEGLDQIRSLFAIIGDRTTLDLYSGR